MPAPKAAGAAMRSRSLVPGYHTSTATRFCAADAVPGPATTVDGRAGARRRRPHVPRGLPLDGGVSGAWLRCGTRTSASGSSSPYSAGLRWTATRNGPASPTIRYDKKISTAGLSEGQGGGGAGGVILQLFIYYLLVTDENGRSTIVLGFH